VMIQIHNARGRIDIQYHALHGAHEVIAGAEISGKGDDGIGQRAFSSQAFQRKLYGSVWCILLLNYAIGGGVSSQDSVPESLRREFGMRSHSANRVEEAALTPSNPDDILNVNETGLLGL
jgi:hypothetical protein